MKNQHFQSSAFAAFSFKKLFSVVFSTVFPCWNLCLFGGRDLPLSDPFLEWFLMVWATFWLPKPSRRPSRTHPKKTSKFDAYFYGFWAVLATAGGTRNREKMLWCSCMVLPFSLQERFCRELDFQEGILVDVGFENVNFRKVFQLFFISFGCSIRSNPVHCKT